jgi:hypothetical protein
VGRTYTETEYHEIFSNPRQDSIPTLPGFSHNAAKSGDAEKKGYIFSTKEIPAGAEILYSFGK